MQTAMILAAGRGTRLPEWTAHTPKPLVPVGGVPVIEHTLARLAAFGVERVVINTHHLGEKLVEALGDGARFGVRIVWSPEEDLLETGGGVRNALPLLGDAPVLCVNGDILWDLDLGELIAGFDAQKMDARLGLVANPPDGGGDFLLQADGRLLRGRGATGALTYSGVQILRPQALAAYVIEPFSLNRLYDDALASGRLFGAPLNGLWADIGSAQRLQRAETLLDAWRARA
ncbi:nucleotidyltransferase family protein [Magnetofaba australis]|nr:nucleotidyltransferase family protein [Magnetofaba australis]